jgi:predicted permease
MRGRLFRALLACFPEAFRARFGDELLETARALDRTHPLRWRDLPAVVGDALVTVRTVRHEMREEAHDGARARRLTMDGLWQDVRQSGRALRRAPAFTLFVIATLALGIGANAAMFGIVNRLLLTGPPGIKDAGAVVRLYLTVQPSGMRVFTGDDFGQVTFDMVRQHATAFQGVAAYAVNDVVVGEGVEAREVRGGSVSASLFPLLGVEPALGRFFRDDEDRPGAAAHVVVLGDGAWHRWFGGAADVVGRTVTLNGDRYAVVGVAPRGFTGPQFGPVEVWLPLSLMGPRQGADWQTTWSAQWLRVIGRLGPGVSRAAAADELTSLLERTYTGDEPYVAHGRMSVADLSADEAGVESPAVTVVRWLFGVTVIVLLIACSNIANLLLARGVRRSREVALRAALGARASRLVRFLLVESMLLALTGALVGIGVAYGLGGLARRLIFSWVDWSASPVDAGVLGASVVCAVATGLAIGILPAWRAARADVVAGLKASARDGGGQRSPMRLVLAIAQAALSVVLLVGAGLFVRSLWNVWTLPLGLDPAQVMVVDITRAPQPRLTDPASRQAAHERQRLDDLALLAEIRHLDGVEHASAAVGMPFGNRFTVGVRVPGLAAVPRLKTGGPSVSAVGEDYFATVGTRILRGRPFGPADRLGSAPVAIVSDTMASTIWPGQDPIGRCFISGPEPSAPCAEIVGIAGSVHRGALREPPVMHYYLPFGQEVGFGGTVLLVRAAGDPLRLGAAVRHAVVGHDPTVRFVKVSTVQDAIDPLTDQWRIGAAVFVSSGLLALVVAGIGIYSVLSYLVADRTREIGVRLALGARRTHVAGLILRGSLGLALIGVGLGCGAALLAGPTIEALLFNESARDPWIYALASLVILAVALLAGLVPTLRANRIDPLEALRAD